MSDQRTVLVTGATDGLGRELAHRLARAGVTLLVHGRDKQRTDKVVAEVSAGSGNDRVSGYVADFSALDDVRRLAEQVRSDVATLDVLVNNAGMGAGRRTDGREVSRDGYELRFAVNYLAPFLLTRLLLPAVGSATPPARIVNVASVGQAPVDFDDLMLERSYEPLRAYSQSKLALIMFTFDLAHELDPARVTANALHPASLMPTKMVFETFGHAASTIEDGADATMRLIEADELAGTTGCYFNETEPARAESQAYDEAARTRLRELSAELVGLRPDDGRPVAS